MSHSRCSRSHIVNPSIKVDTKSVRAFSTPTMQTHSSPSSPTKILHSGASQSSVKSLFAKAPQKAKAKAKKENVIVRESPAADVHDSPNDPTNDDDLFDKEASDDDEISVELRHRLECSARTAFARCSSTRSAKTQTRSPSPRRSRSRRRAFHRSPSRRSAASRSAAPCSDRGGLSAQGPFREASGGGAEEGAWEEDGEEGEGGDGGGRFLLWASEGGVMRRLRGVLRGGAVGG